MKKRLTVGVVALLLVILLTGCKPYICPPSFLEQPLLSAPADYSVVTSLTPNLSWTFPKVIYPPNNQNFTVCIPEFYKVELKKGPFYNNSLGGEISGLTNSYVPSTLQAGRSYRWYVIPKSKGELGPASASRIFFTGDVCETELLAAPLPASPYNGADIAELLPSLIWEYSEECRPEGYRIDLSTEPLFADTSLAGGTGNSDTIWSPASPLADCTRYYWKVAAINDTTLGPASATFTFRTNLGACGPDVGVPGSTISGNVWADLCSAPDAGPLPVTLPVGCVPSGSGATANGILDAGEPGIANVLVRLGSGACPSSDKGVTFTDENGDFSFDGIPGGEYCVSIDATENVDVLLPGQWTYPVPSAPNAAGAFQSMTVADGDAEVNVNFGWHYKNGTKYSSISGVVWNDECPVTSESYTGLPPIGCVKGYWGNVYADGIRQPTEHGIAGVSVVAFAGNCGSTTPLTVHAVTHTDTQGNYHFLLPLEGTWKDYCISIDAADPSNTPVMHSGRWTYDLIPFANKHNWDNIQIHGGETLTRDWGWDFVDILSVVNPTLIPELTFPGLDLPDDAYCYVGPSFDYRAFLLLPKGSHFSILGIDPTGNWYMIDPDEEYTTPTDRTSTPTPVSLTRCWVPKRNSSASGDLSYLGVFSGPRFTPTPTPTVTPRPQTKSCSEYQDPKSCQEADCYWHNYMTHEGGYCSDTP